MTKKNYYLPLTDLGIIQVTGQNAAQFLQGQLTCDIKTVDSTRSCLGAHCNAKGRVQGIFRLFFYQDTYHFLLPRCLCQLLLQSLQKYALFSAVTLTDISEKWKKIGVYGPSIAKLLERFNLLTGENENTISSKTTLNLTIHGPTPRSILLTTDANLIRFINQAFYKAPLNAWPLLDIIAGIPTIYPETSLQFTPHQLNLPTLGGVSFDKGCYIGQEIIARTHYLGKSKSRLCRVSFQAKQAPLPGTPLICPGENPPQGTVLTAANEGEDRYQALVCLQNQAVSHTIYLGNLQGPLLCVCKDNPPSNSINITKK